MSLYLYFILLLLHDIESMYLLLSVQLISQPSQRYSVTALQRYRGQTATHRLSRVHEEKRESLLSSAQQQHDYDYDHDHDP